ncbi:hypothetical protein OROHE_027137 [Orobanche hederae]
MVEAATLPTNEVPIQPTVMQPAKERTSPVRQVTIRGEPNRGRAFFERDPEKYARARQDDPNRPALVVDFLAARSRQHEMDVPSHIARVQESLPKAWTSELEAIARWGPVGI